MNGNLVVPGREKRFGLVDPKVVIDVRVSSVLALSMRNVGTTGECGQITALAPTLPQT